MKNHDQPICEEQRRLGEKAFRQVFLNVHAPLPGCFECARLFRWQHLRRGHRLPSITPPGWPRVSDSRRVSFSLQLSLVA